MKQEKYSASKSTFKFIANILSWTALALLLVIAAFLLYLAVSAKLYAAKGEKYEPKFSLYTIISPSMEPNLRVYDIIVDQRVDSVNDIKIGDVITFISTSSISANKTITHRVIDIVVDKEGNYQYKTKGDNNLSPDLAYAEYDNIIGKVIFKIPQLGRIQFFLANQGGWLIAVVIPALIIIIKDVMKIFKLAKINKKAEGIVEGTKIEDEEEKKKRQELELTRKKHLKDKFRLKFKNEEVETADNSQEENIVVSEPLIKEEKEELVVYSNSVPLTDEISQDEDQPFVESTETNYELEVSNINTEKINDNYYGDFNTEPIIKSEESAEEEIPVAPAVMDLELPTLKKELPEIKDTSVEINNTEEELEPELSILNEGAEEINSEVSDLPIATDESQELCETIEQPEESKITEDDKEPYDKNNDFNEEVSQEESSSVVVDNSADTDIYDSIFNHFDNLEDNQLNEQVTEAKTNNNQNNATKKAYKKRTNNKKNGDSRKHK